MFVDVIPRGRTHCIRLARPCLTIGKDANIVPVNRTLNQTLCLIEDLFLRAVRAKNRIELVVLDSIPLNTDTQRSLVRYLETGDSALRVFFLRFTEWSDAGIYSHFTLQVLQLI